MKRPVMAAIALLLVLGFFGVLGVLFYAMFAKVTLDGALKETLLIMLGSLGTMVTMVVSFYFGSSQSSQAKDALIASK